MSAKHFKMRQKIGVGYLITSVVSLGLTLLVGNQILESVGTVVGNVSGTPFETALVFLGMDSNGTGTWTTTAIVGILGLVAVAGFVLSFVKVSFKGF